jgi:hypothetical protein
MKVIVPWSPGSGMVSFQDLCLTMIITHFVNCLIAQERLEDDFQACPYVSELNAKKRSPLPLFQKGLQHINLDARTLYYLIKHAKNLEHTCGRSSTDPDDPVWLQSAAAFEKNRPLVCQWIHRVFNFHRWKRTRSGGGKWRVSDDKGIFATSNGVDIRSVILRNRDDEVTLRQSNRMLNLSPAHDDDDDEEEDNNEEDDDEEDDDVSMEIPDDRPTFVASIDPGRRNIIYCIITDTDGNFLKRVVLTRAGYYDTAKIDAVCDRINERNRKEELKEMVHCIFRQSFPYI